MLAKFSAVAMCLSFVSAFNIEAPATVQAGTEVTLHLSDIDTHNPLTVSLVLVQAEYPSFTNLVPDAFLNSTTTTVHIPVADHGEYFIIANPIHNQHEVLAQSNIFVVNYPTSISEYPQKEA